MKYTTYLFDFDGTLIDSMPSFIAVMLKILEENQIEYGNDIVKTITPLGYLGTAKYFKELGVPLPLSEMVSLMQQYIYDAYAYHIPAKTNVIATLKELKKHGADLNILTASPHSVLDVCLKRLGIFDIFTNIWSCDDFGTTKADAEIYKMAALKIGKPIEEILFLDDNYNADKTAKAAGMKVCGVYDASSEDYIADIKSVADHYIYDFSELVEL